MDFTDHRLASRATTVAPTTVGNIVTTTVVAQTTVAQKPLKTGSAYDDVNALYDDLHDLINQDPSWRPWYCKTFHTLGRDRVHKYASIARQEFNKDPRRYFSDLLKNGRSYGL